MFKFIERAILQQKLRNTPYDIKVNAITKIVERVIRTNPKALMPIITRIGIVMNYIFEKRLVNYYFLNKRQIPLLCEDLNCL